MLFQDSLKAEQARFIHRTQPTAALGTLLCVTLVALVFRDVVPSSPLYAWFSAFVVLTVIRMMLWWRYRGADFSLVGRAWLRDATVAAGVSGLIWGAGSLFLFPPGLIIYQFTFMVALVMMCVASMFTYSPHYPTYFAYILPSMIPGAVGLAIQDGPQQQAMAAGVSGVVVTMLYAVRGFNQMFVESMRLRFENVELVAQLTVQKDAAESANLAKSRFMAAASHDLQQPIHALNLYLSAFGEQELPRKASALLVKLRQCGALMDEMFRALLDISRLDAGSIRPQVSVFALAPLLTRARLEFEPEARAKGIELRVKRCSACACSDPALVERVLRNLISNAVRHTEQGRVVVGCRRRGNTLRICVYDTGPGIDPHEQVAVFEEFYQVGNRERDRSKGLGLGLSIVERLSRLLRAPLTVRSQLGKGSLFAFDLQQAEHADMPSMRQARREGDAENLSGTTVVLVDDEELSLDAAQTLLEQWGCTVIPAPSASVALQRLATSTTAPDVLICDYKLRDDETGLGVIETLRTEFNTDIPAVVLTGESDPDEVRHVARNGLAVLQKPLHEEELKEVLRALRLGVVRAAV